MPCIFLLDNGSFRANATLQLRALADKLSVLSGLKVHPVSCQHSDKIAVEKLEGEPAVTFEQFMKIQLAAGEKDYIALPLFFGQSRAITDFVPNTAANLEQEYGPFHLRVADSIYPLPAGEKDLTEIIYEHLLSCSPPRDQHCSLKNCVLVDHGSPVPRVTAVREHLAESVRQKLQGGDLLEEAVMERRAGERYDFNGILLQDWLTQKAQSGEIYAAVVLLFFLPGSHAGEGGDIVDICDSVMEKFPSFKVVISPLICENPKLVSILNKRLSSQLER